MVFLGLNPSTADGETDDNSVRRMVGFALGFGGTRLDLGNLFAFRSTDPAGLSTVLDPVGPDNDSHLFELCTQMNATVIAAWGAHPFARVRAKEVTRLLHQWDVQPFCLGTNRDGSPKHPLYVPGKAQLLPWVAP